MNRLESIKEALAEYKADEDLLSPPERGYLEDVEYLLQEIESLQYKYDKYRETALNRIGYDEDRMNTISEELEFLRNHYRQSFSFMVALLQKNGGKLEIPWNDIAVVPHPDIVEIVKYEDIKTGSWVYELKPKHTL